MSFILDALKKSEIERQRQSVPGLMDAGPAPRRARFPAWAIALAALLAVNLAVLIIVLARGGLSGLSGHHAAAQGAAAPRVAAPPSSATSTRPPAVQAAPPVAAAAPPSASSAPSAGAAPGADANHFSPMDAAPPVYAPEIPADREPQAGSATGSAGGAGQASRTAPPDSSATRAARDPLLTGGADKGDQEVLPSLSELDLTGANALPDLHLDVHVYATNPSERFVYINMRKYREGNTLAEGPVLERIRRDGVVLDYRGLRFLLPRQQ
jgi:general secretion pathway protein B